MIVENELTAAKVYTKSSSISYIVKSVILLSTITLIALVVRFHIVEVKVRAIQIYPTLRSFNTSNSRLQ